MKKKRKMLTMAESVGSKRQHQVPCVDCPFARTALSGWLGGLTAADYASRAHADAPLRCHTRHRHGGKAPEDSWICVGASAYRRNVCKRRAPGEPEIENSDVMAFQTPMQFVAYHEGLLTVDQHYGLVLCLVQQAAGNRTSRVPTVRYFMFRYRIPLFRNLAVPDGYSATKEVANIVARVAASVSKKMLIRYIEGHDSKDILRTTAAMKKVEDEESDDLPVFDSEEALQKALVEFACR